MAEAASNLYAASQQIEKQYLDISVAEEFPNHSLVKSINARLKRAYKR